MTSFYDTFMAPLEKKWLGKIRKNVISKAHGHVLEIGYGTGVNIKYMAKNNISSLTALDLDIDGMTHAHHGLPVHFIKGIAEALPFDDETFDSVIETLVLCSVSDVNLAVSEAFRVLKPGGLFIYIDHVLPEHKIMTPLFKGANLIWPHIASGCEVIRQPHLIIAAKSACTLVSGSAANTVFRYGVVQK